MHKTFMAVLLSSISVASAAAIAQSATGDVPAWAAEAQMNPNYGGPAPAAKEATEPAASETLQDSSSAPAATPAWAAEATMNPNYVANSPPASNEAPTEAAAAPASAPAWAAEATMNPDYVAGAPSPAEPASEAAAAAEIPTATPAWAAEATMNPDYRAETPAAPEAGQATAEPAAEPTAPAAPATTAAEPAVEQPAPAAVAAPTPSEPGVTQYFGTSESTERPAWAADAKMNPDYVAAPPAAAPTPAAATPTATQDEVSPERQQQVEACRDALNGELQTARLMFGSGKWDILPISYGGLDRIAKIAKDCGDVVIEVDGHTDNTGKPDSNVTISVLRAEAVVKYLIQAGVDAANLRAVGHGGTKPIASNDTAEGRRKNRRIEFIVWDRGHPPS